MTAEQRGAAITHSTLFQGLPPVVQADVRTAVTRIIAANSGVDMLSLQRVLASPFFTKASLAQRREMLSVINKMPLNPVDTRSSEQGIGGNRPLQALAMMAERSIDGTPMLLTTASDGSSLVHQLAEMTDKVGSLPPTDVMIKGSGLSGIDIVAGCILEVNDTGRVAQGNVGTCASTSIQIGLIEQRPAEYLRLCNGLLVDGTVKMVNGHALVRVPSSISPSPSNYRTPTERLFQSAVLDYGNGNEKEYSVRTENIITSSNVAMELPVWAQILLSFFCFPSILILLCVETDHIDEATRETNSGMYDDEIQRSLQAIYGRPFETYPGSGTGAATFLYGMGNHGHFEDTLTLVSLKWSEKKASDKGELLHAYHALRLERMDPPDTTPRMVYMHNPWGSEPRKKKGEMVSNNAPDSVIWEDPSRGIVAMPYDDFANRLDSSIAPRG